MCVNISVILTVEYSILLQKINAGQFYFLILELPVSSPLCHAVLKTLQCWEQVLLRRLEVHGGPPQNYIASYTSEESLSAGPAILRHKALLEPTNTPFK